MLFKQNVKKDIQPKNTHKCQYNIKQCLKWKAHGMIKKMMSFQKENKVY